MKQTASKTKASLRHVLRPMQTRRGRWGAAGIIGGFTAIVIVSASVLPSSVRFCIFFIALVGIVVAYAAGRRWDKAAQEAHDAPSADTLTA